MNHKGKRTSSQVERIRREAQEARQRAFQRKAEKDRREALEAKLTDVIQAVKVWYEAYKEVEREGDSYTHDLAALIDTNKPIAEAHLRLEQAYEALAGIAEGD